MTSVPWESIYRPSEHDPFKRRGGILGLIGNTERWLNLVLLLVALLAMSDSLERANWVDEMPSLTAAALFGLATGWVLAQLPLRAWLLQIVGIAIGLGWVFAIVMANMELADPLLGTGVQQRWSELWLRLRDWGTALVEGGVSSDPLPFVLMLVFATWAVAYLAAWAVVRWRNAWVALIPPGFVLLTNISYLPGQPSLQFVVFLFASVLLVLQLHFAKALHRWREERIAWPDLMSMEVAFAGVWIALALIIGAWLIPTANNWGPVADTWNRAVDPITQRFEGLSRVFIGVSSKRDIPVHGLGEVLPLQGDISFSSEPLMEVTSDEPGNLRGATYDEYTGAGWVNSGVTKQPLLGTTIEAAEFGTPLSQAQLRRPVRIDVTVLGDVPDRRLLSFGDPLATDVPADLLYGASPLDLVGIVPDDRLEVGSTYTVVGAVSGASVDTLLASDTDYPDAIAERYLPLPDDLPPEVGELAESIAGGQHPYIAARAIEDYLRQNYPFSTETADPPPLHDAVDYFLFDAQAGYFDHHATAMAVMLRTLGIPTRMAAGFVLDEESYDDTTKSYTLSEENAWAWPEVYFNGLGWVEFNPTPGRALVVRPGDDSPLRAQLGGTSAVPGINEDELLLELEQLFATEGSPATDLDALNSGGSSSGVGAVVVQGLTVLVGVAVVVLVLALIVRFLWERGVRDLPAPQRRWAKLQRLAGWAAIEPRMTRTPLEWAREVAATAGAPEEFRAVALDYTRARYGMQHGEASEEADAAVRESYRLARNRLWRRVAGRFMPRRRRSAVGESASVGL
jgi:transglutaminase-like putative cysteine protease